METSQRPILSILLTDAPEAHERLYNCVRRRAPSGFSLGTATGEEPGMARTTVVLDGGRADAQACLRHVDRVIDVAEAALLAKPLCVRLAVVRIEAGRSQRSAALRLQGGLGARVLHCDETTLVAQLSERPEALDAALGDLRRLVTVRVLQSGLIAVPL